MSYPCIGVRGTPELSSKKRIVYTYTTVLTNSPRRATLRTKQPNGTTVRPWPIRPRPLSENSSMKTDHYGALAGDRMEPIRI